MPGEDDAVTVPELICGKCGRSLKITTESQHGTATLVCPCGRRYQFKRKTVLEAAAQYGWPLVVGSGIHSRRRGGHHLG